VRAGATHIDSECCIGMVPLSVADNAVYLLQPVLAYAPTTWSQIVSAYQRER
jgi:hypothetical protein